MSRYTSRRRLLESLKNPERTDELPSEGRRSGMKEKTQVRKREYDVQTSRLRPSEIDRPKVFNEVKGNHSKKKKIYR